MTDNILIDLSYYLKDTNILKVLLPIIDQFLRYTFKTNEELKYAVDKWCDKRHKKIYGHISYWNTKYITDMSNLFVNKENFNDNISFWNTSNVANMNCMFVNAISFNKPLNWDTSNISKFDNMFDYCPISEENKLKFEINY